ncbi:MAG: class I poly(R)-hydroxyalkanoic acid synthase [Rhodobacteraceae bacterium]|nr:class I poly(R)-hydroxyalkanoic acid synthase [Paracoccaceae bacterium]
MTTSDESRGKLPDDASGDAADDPGARLSQNLAKVDALSKRLNEVMARRATGKSGHNKALDGPDQELFARAMTSYWTKSLADPGKLMQQQMELWSQSVAQFAAMQRSEERPTDRRFANPMWESNPYFAAIKQQYLMNAEMIEKAVDEVEDMDDLDKRRLGFFSRQIIDMMAPTNFLATNPDALEKAVETEGQSLLDGLENLISDLEANDGELVVRLADETAFEIGGNIATTPGDVIYRNRMMELIQYRPTTDKVHEIPVILFPPWINKFYILDLKEKNSLIKWITEQGYTLFVVSWINPDASYAETGMEDYIEDGYLAAIREVKAICGVKQVNTVGYCIAGTTLAMTLSLLKQRGDKSIRSATFFTALTDFSDQGEFTPFLQNDFIDGIEEEVKEQGLLRSFIMARTFSYLRSTDLIYTPAIRSYMMGQTPPAFDLLFWNGDGANLPALMAVQYLRGLCQRNEFAEGGIDLMGHTLRLDEVDVPLCSIACETDHIAPWINCYRGVQQMGGRSRTFIVTQSGHIAGIVNPPSKKKYGHYTNEDMALDPGDWLESADFHQGSWWPRWEGWLRKRSGKMVAARAPGDSSHEVLEAAPGSYVKLKASR